MPDGSMHGVRNETRTGSCAHNDNRRLDKTYAGLL